MAIFIPKYFNVEYYDISILQIEKKGIQILKEPIENISKPTRLDLQPVIYKHQILPTKPSWRWIEFQLTL